MRNGTVYSGITRAGYSVVRDCSMTSALVLQGGKILVLRWGMRKVSCNIRMER